MKTKLLTVVFPVTDREVLLGMKKRGFGAGKWNGFGGKVEEGESTEEAARREIREESGLSAGEFAKVGAISFSFTAGDDRVHNVHIFLCSDFNGEPQETEEMRPRWFPKTDLPLEEMWDGDRIWLPRVIAGEAVSGSVLFTSEGALSQDDLIFSER